MRTLTGLRSIKEYIATWFMPYHWTLYSRWQILHFRFNWTRMHCVVRQGPCSNKRMLRAPPTNSFMLWATSSIRLICRSRITEQMRGAKPPIWCNDANAPVASGQVPRWKALIGSRCRSRHSSPSHREYSVKVFPLRLLREASRDRAASERRDVSIRWRALRWVLYQIFPSCEYPISNAYYTHGHIT